MCIFLLEIMFSLKLVIFVDFLSTLYAYRELEKKHLNGLKLLLAVK